MTNAQDYVVCSACGEDRIVTEVIPHPTRLFTEVGQCENCGVWLEWDGRRISVRTPAQIAALYRGEVVDK